MSEAKQVKVLIVDDMQAMRAMSKSLVTALGAEVVGEAENGQLGFELYCAEKPDLVLLDIEMPVKDGISIVSTNRAGDSRDFFRRDATDFRRD